MSNVEERARNMGWLDKEEFEKVGGNPDQWRPADEFLERGENIMPILKERLTKLEDSLSAKSSQLEKVTNSLTKFAEFHKGTYKRAYEKAKRDIQIVMQQAREDGDFEAYEAAVNEKTRLENEEKQISGEQSTDVVPEFYDFQKANPWYGKDLAMTVFIDAIGGDIAKRVSNDVEFYAELEKAARQEFPHKFTRVTANAVEGGGGSSDGGSNNKKTWRDLPKEAQEAYIREFSSIPNFTKEQYAKDFFSQE